MKDYTTNEFDKKKFIIKYVIDSESNTIDIIYANFEVLTVPYSADKERQLLELMKKQVEDNYTTMQDNQRSLFSYQYARVAFILITIMLLILTALFMGLAMTAHNLMWLIYAPLAIAALSGTIFFRKATNIAHEDQKELEDKIDDYEKCLYFLQNSKYLDNEALTECENLSELPEKIQFIIGERVFSGYDEIDALNLNSISAVPVEELKKTKELVLRPKKIDDK